MIAKKETDKEA
jgi:hypothetical protein